MNIEQLATLTTEVAEGRLIVRISGELDGSNAPNVGDAIVAAAADTHACVVDLTLVTYLDSAALTMLHRLAQQATTLYVVMPPGSRAARLIEIGGLDTVLRTHPTVEAALEAV